MEYLTITDETRLGRLRHSQAAGQGVRGLDRIEISLPGLIRLSAPFMRGLIRKANVGFLATSNASSRRPDHVARMDHRDPIHPTVRSVPRVGRRVHARRRRDVLR
jgi:hypothetical protein